MRLGLVVSLLTMTGSATAGYLHIDCHHHELDTAVECHTSHPISFAPQTIIWDKAAIKSGFQAANVSAQTPPRLPRDCNPPVNEPRSDWHYGFARSTVEVENDSPKMLRYDGWVKDVDGVISYQLCTASPTQEYRKCFCTKRPGKVEHTEL